MRFQEELARRSIARFAGHYLDYARLKALCLDGAERARAQREESRPPPPPGTGDGEPPSAPSAAAASSLGALQGRQALTRVEASAVASAFMALLSAELHRVDRFAASVHGALVRERGAYIAARNVGLADARELVLAERRLWHAVAELRDFAEVNYTATYKIVKKIDKELGTHQLDTVIWMVERLPFMRLLGPAAASGSSGGGDSSGGGGGGGSSDGGSGSGGGETEGESDLENGKAPAVVAAAAAAATQVPEEAPAKPSRVGTGGAGSGAVDGGGASASASSSAAAAAAAAVAASAAVEENGNAPPLLDTFTSTSIAQMLRASLTLAPASDAGAPASTGASAAAATASFLPPLPPRRDSLQTAGCSTVGSENAEALAEAAAPPPPPPPIDEEVAAEAAAPSGDDESVPAAAAAAGAEEQLALELRSRLTASQHLRAAAVSKARLDSVFAVAEPAARSKAALPALAGVASHALLSASSATREERVRVRGVDDVLARFRKTQARVYATAGAMLDSVSPEVAASEVRFFASTFCRQRERKNIFTTYSPPPPLHLYPVLRSAHRRTNATSAWPT